MRVLHAYHVYADGQWRNPVAEHLAALDDAKFDGNLLLGIVGAAERRAEVIEEFGWLRKPKYLVEADEGWEQVTIEVAHQLATTGDCDAVLYAHTKGAANVRVFQDQWRQSMTTNLISKWQNARDALASGHYDVIGCHWLTEEEFAHIRTDTTYPMFGGNFWMATAKYLADLPPVGTSVRHEAESWVGQNKPRVIDLTPGWPGTVPFPRFKMRRLVVTSR